MNTFNRLADLQVPLAGRLLGTGEGSFNKISTNTRTLKKGDLFLALKGKKYDGHDFISHAESQGAAAFIVSQELAIDKPQLVVKDTGHALGRLGGLHRLAWQGTLTAVTGSNGKTTIKEIIGAILGQKGKTLVTPFNENNHLGVPMTLLRLDESYQYAVIEVGADKPGEIGYGAKLAQPQISVLSNVYPSHLSGFGTIDKLAEEKGDLIKHTLANGTVVLGGDSKYCDLWRGMAKGRKVITFSAQRQDADVQVRDFSQEKQGIRFRLGLEEGWTEFSLSLLGKHNALNAAAACAVGQELEVNTAQIRKALSDFKPLAGRMFHRRLGQNCLLIDDSYNANPASTFEALKVLKDLSWQGKKIAILGDMLELGDKEEAEHLKLKKMHEQLDGFLTFGKLASLILKNRKSDSLHKAFYNKDELISHLASQKLSNMAFLVKGSRGMRMEEVADFLRHKLGEEG